MKPRFCIIRLNHILVQCDDKIENRRNWDDVKVVFQKDTFFIWYSTTMNLCQIDASIFFPIYYPFHFCISVGLLFNDIMHKCQTPNPKWSYEWAIWPTPYALGKEVGEYIKHVWIDKQSSHSWISVWQFLEDMPIIIWPPLVKLYFINNNNNKIRF